MRSAPKISNRRNLSCSLLCLLFFIFSYSIVEAEEPSSAGKAEQESEVIFQLIEPIRFADGREVKSIAQSEIDGLRDLPVSFGENKGIDGVTLTKILGIRKAEEVHVRTCREYDAARKNGYEPLSTFDITMATFFKKPCGLLNALANASLPRESFISDAEVGIANVELLPFSVFAYVGDGKSPEETKRDSETTYQQKIETGELVVKEKSENVLIIEEPGMGQSLQELVRADFNNDGVEDILLFEYHWATEGTLRFGGIMVLTRLSMNGKFQVLRPIDSKQSSSDTYWFQ